MYVYVYVYVYVCMYVCMSVYVFIILSNLFGIARPEESPPWPPWRPAAAPSAPGTSGACPSLRRWSSTVLRAGATSMTNSCGSCWRRRRQITEDGTFKEWCVDMCGRILVERWESHGNMVWKQAFFGMEYIYIYIYIYYSYALSDVRGDAPVR